MEGNPRLIEHSWFRIEQAARDKSSFSKDVRFAVADELDADDHVHWPVSVPIRLAPCSID
jgi:hypothetical protein